MSIVIGVELKQHRCAFCVVDSQHRDDGVYFFVRHLERLPVRTPFVRVGDRLGEVLLKTKAKGKTVGVYVNETDVAAPVVDLIQQSVRDSVRRYLGFSGSHLQRCTLFQGRQEPTFAGSTLTLGKGWIVSRLTTLLQTGQLQFPKSEEASILADDLLKFDGAPAGTVPDAPGSFRVGTQDDLINALGLAVHADPPRQLKVKQRSSPPRRLTRRSPWEALYGPDRPGALRRL